MEPDSDAALEPRPQPAPDFLLPEGFQGVDRFGFSVSKAVFNGWAAQPSPCCAAASVAGACNAALGLKFDEPAAITTAHVAGLYHEMCSEQAMKREQSISRLLGVPTIAPVVDELKRSLAAEGLSLGGRKEKACKAKQAISRLRVLCDARSTPAADAAPDAAADNTLWCALAEVLPLTTSSSNDKENGNGGGNDEDAAGDEDLPGGEGQLGGGGQPGADGGYASKVRSELSTLFSKLGAMEQLAPELAKPCTWFIGNWGIKAAVSALRGPAFDAPAAPDGAAAGGTAGSAGAEEGGSAVGGASDPRLESLRGGDARRPALCSRLRSRTLVGQRVKGQAPPPILLRKADDDEAREAAWGALKAAFAMPHCSLLLHIKGHYSLVFAMREWVGEGGDEKGDEGAAAEAPPAPPAEAERSAAAEGKASPRRVRQILTCRKGQKPSVWLDWQEVHGYIAGWTGYAIMEVSAVAE